MTDEATGTIMFVGAGPGNPELLTVRAREVLSTTAHAVVDPEVNDAIRAVVGAELPVPQEKIAAVEAQYQQACEDAKNAGSRRRPPRPAAPGASTIIPAAASVAEVVAQLRELTQDGTNVIRLVAGNPLTNSATLEEIQAADAAGERFLVVPGMSVPSTVPAFAGIALGSTYTESDVADPNLDWDQLAAAPQPLVLQATSEDLPTITRLLRERDLAAATPCSVTVGGTTRLQRTYDTTLATLGKLSVDLEGPLVVTVGTSPDSRSKYSWWESRALYGWRVLVPRAKDQAGPMSTRLATHGAIPQEVPTISVEPPRNPAPMERAIKGIVEGRYQWVVFTSVNAVKAVQRVLRDFGLDARAFAGIRIAAVGQKTAAAVGKWGITPELLPPAKAHNAAGLVSVFPEYDEDLDPVSRVLLPRADIATETLVEGLKELGWEVDDIVAYRTVRAAPPSAEVRDLIKTGGFDAVCFTSASTVRNLVGIAGKPHPRTIIACIGPMAAAAAQEVGLRVDVQPEVAGVPELVDALAEHVAALRAADQLPPPRKKRRSRASS